ASSADTGGMPLHCTYSQPMSRNRFSVPTRSCLAGSRTVYKMIAMLGFFMSVLLGDWWNRGIVYGARGTCQTDSSRDTPQRGRRLVQSPVFAVSGSPGVGSARDRLHALV